MDIITYKFMYIYMYINLYIKMDVKMDVKRDIKKDVKMDINTSMWGKNMKNNEKNGKKEEKIPLICIKILQELERVAPQEVHMKDLAFKCNTSSQIINRKIALYPEFFRFVEAIKYEGYIKYKLNIDKKLKEQQDKIKKPILFRIKMYIFMKKK